MLETVGRYKVQEKIGEGAMADVYRAYDPSINRALAIKVLKQEFLQDEEYAARFLREAKAAGALSHPNIVTIFDVGEADGHPYIVMELLDGKPLDRFMAERTVVNVDESMNIGMQLARALDYAHAQGIIHRDIKPSNIMITTDGQSVKILDYGIARLNETDALLGQEVLKTQVGAVLGTPRYMSPEQALGQTSDGRSDLYSVGIVLYELLTGKKAFSSGSMATLMLQITQQDPEPINKIAPDIPGGLVFIVNKLLAKKPEKRFQKGSELYAALKREQASMEAQKAEKTKPRSMPLPIKVTLIATAFVLSLLGISIWAALNKQNKVMEQMSVTSGSAITSFVAKNIGPTMAIQDWDQTSVFVKVAAEDKNVDDILVVDNGGIIRGAKNQTLEGTRYRGVTGKKLSSRNGVDVVETTNKSGNRVFLFSQPVNYANGAQGKVHVGLKQSALEAAFALSRNVLLGLGLLTLLSVMAVAYTIAAVLARPIKRLKEAFTDASKGNLDFRISHKRKDEFGELFDGFNNMLTAVQSRVDTAEGFTGDLSSSTSLKLTGTMAGRAALAAMAPLSATPFSKPEEPAPATPEPENPIIDTHEEDVPVTHAPEEHAVAEAPQEDMSAPDLEPEIAAMDAIEIEPEPVEPAMADLDDISPVTTDEPEPQPEVEQPEPEPASELELELEPEVEVKAEVEPEVVMTETDLAPVTADIQELDEPKLDPLPPTVPEMKVEPTPTPQQPVQQQAVEPQSVEEDYDRTLIRQPDIATPLRSLPVNPLASISSDDDEASGNVADEFVEEDMDKTIVRSPTR